MRKLKIDTPTAEPPKNCNMAALSKPAPVVVNPPLPSDPEPLNLVETPTSPSSGSVLSRFEFETDKGNDGTKILLVEWDTGVAGKEASGKPDTREWDVSWEGKTHVLPIRDPDTESRTLRRVLYLLPPGAHIPSLVSISHRSGSPVLRTNPLPAIFPAALGTATGVRGGGRGVLHTIWAKRWLAELDTEIASEMKTNSESIGLQIALQDREWVSEHFGLADPSAPKRPSSSHLGSPSPASPTSPRSPVGGRLGEKLRGLKLATSPADLAAATFGKDDGCRARGEEAHTLTAHAASKARNTATGNGPASGFQTRTPPKSSIDPAVASLDTVLGGGTVKGAAAEPVEGEEELFALPLSPRSPDMAKSPFSVLK